MKSSYPIFSILSFLLLFSSCSTDSIRSMSYTSIVILFILLILCFVVMFILIAKVKRQEHRKMAQYVNNVNKMLAKYELPEHKIKELNILISRIENDPKYAKDEVWKNKVLAKTYSFLATIYYKTGDENQTLEICSKIIELSPDDSMTLYNRGTLYMNKKRFHDAIDDFTSCIEIQSNHASAYNNRGMAYERLNKVDEANNDYKTALDIEESTIIHLNYGNILYKQHDIDNAIIHIEKALELCNENDTKLKREIELVLSNVRSIKK